MKKISIVLPNLRGGGAERQAIYLANDWLTRGGVPKIEESLCRNLGIEILYLETVTNSSSKLLQNWTADLES